MGQIIAVIVITSFRWRGGRCHHLRMDHDDRLGGQILPPQAQNGFGHVRRTASGAGSGLATNPWTTVLPHRIRDTTELSHRVRDTMHGRSVLLSTGENRRAGPPAIVLGPAGILGFYAGEILNQVPGDSRRSRDGLVLG